MISIISTLYNSKSTVLRFAGEVLGVMSEASEENFELILVSDGDLSISNELENELIMLDRRIKLIKLSRNFGQHLAIYCGLENSIGDEIIILDSDLEEDPKDISRFLNELRCNNFEVVIGLQSERNKDTIFGELYWRAISFNRQTPVNICTFRAFTRKYANYILDCKDESIILVDLDNHLGFEKSYLKITKKYKGVSSYSSSKKLEFFLSTVILSNPKALIYATSIISLLTFIFILLALGITIFRLSSELSAGWASIIVSIFVLMSINLISFGVIFFYLSRILNQVRIRPRYVIDEVKTIKEENENLT